MAKRVQKHLKTLEVLESAKPKLRKGILENADSDLIRCICECCLNILSGNIELTPEEKRRLFHHKTLIRKLCSKNLPVEERRDILIQKGGFLPALLGPIIGIVSSLLGSIAK